MHITAEIIFLNDFELLCLLAMGLRGGGRGSGGWTGRRIHFLEDGVTALDPIFSVPSKENIVGDIPSNLNKN